MRRRRLVMLTLVAALALASIAVVSSAVGHRARSTGRPTLALTHRSPVTVRGRHFRGGRRVRLSLVLARRFTQTVTPSAGGGFTASFAAAIDRCGPSVTAVQGATQLVLRGPAKPLCAPAGAP